MTEVFSEAIGGELPKQIILLHLKTIFCQVMKKCINFARKWMMYNDKKFEQ